MIGAEPMFQKLKILIMKYSIFLKINDYLLFHLKTYMYIYYHLFY